MVNKDGMSRLTLPVPSPGSCTGPRGQEDRIRMGMQDLLEEMVKAGLGCCCLDPFPSWAASVDAGERVLLISAPLTPLFDH